MGEARACDQIHPGLGVRTRSDLHAGLGTRRAAAAAARAPLPRTVHSLSVVPSSTSPPTTFVDQSFNVQSFNIYTVLQCSPTSPTYMYPTTYKLKRIQIRLTSAVLKQSLYDDMYNQRLSESGRDLEEGSGSGASIQAPTSAETTGCVVMVTHKSKWALRCGIEAHFGFRNARIVCTAMIPLHSSTAIQLITLH